MRRAAGVADAGFPFSVWMHCSRMCRAARRPWSAWIGGIRMQILRGKTAVIGVERSLLYREDIAVLGDDLVVLAIKLRDDRRRPRNSA